MPIQTPPRVVDQDRVDSVGAQRVELLRVALVVVQAARPGIPDIETAAIGADPDVTGAIARQRRHAAARQVQAVLGAGAQVVEAARTRVETRDAAAVRADPGPGDEPKRMVFPVFRLKPPTDFHSGCSTGRTCLE